MLAVSFGALQYDLFLVMSFIIVYFCAVLFVCMQCEVHHLLLCRYAVSGSAISCFAVMLAASSVLWCSMSYGWHCCLVLCNMNYVWQCHMAGRVTLLCSVSFWLCQLLLCSVDCVWQSVVVVLCEL